MNKKRLTVVGIFILLAILLLLLIVGIVNNKPLISDNENDEEDKNKVEKTKEELFEEDKNKDDLKGYENVNVIARDNAINTSNKVKEVKKIGNLELSDILVEFNGHETKITGNILNKEDKDFDADFVSMNILDSDNNVFHTSEVYIGEVKANSSKRFDFLITANIVNLYDITFNK